MSVIVPTITAGDSREFQRQLERIQPFTKRIHLDLMDGMFAPSKSLPVADIHLPDDVQVDVHVMYLDPVSQLDSFLMLKPKLVILHAEANGDIVNVAKKLRLLGVRVGMAMLPPTSVTAIAEHIELLDHVLIFSGNLGFQGGSQANPNLLSKINELRRLKQDIEIGWDGGVNDSNVRALAQAGIDVINVGGFIQQADDPTNAYQCLVDLVDG
ncbi:hypothetical protein KDA23_03070 [Candidatus Saccharibacteria bacterium]|nr:hypothetical protein [Candidatus Saccharibacteria bacterium]